MSIRLLTTSSELMTCASHRSTNTLMMGFGSATRLSSLRGLKYSPYDGLRKRPSQSPAMRKEDEKFVFPTTLKSGRYEQKGTIAQKLYKGPAQAASDSAAADTRFFRKLEDYREIQENDPYAKLFGDTKATAKTRLNAWQRQFEEENANVELPYERTNVLAKTAPNWFVRYFVNLRDRGGANSLSHLVIFLLFVGSILALVTYFLYTPPDKARPTMELR
ncbi:transmembrane protein, putative [Bodo saltans]|uniref:Transmembrane protein, putative n=1 Tax=Bodo saltans TaxID=75058 RepID=A0A0S4J4W7_BODSA|nr:transmembrane protein, putative [Bodo saltans]|eukprot:CUG23502.1 transmembrane protein, putative [Bodo saltans]